MRLFVFLSAVALASCSPITQDDSVMRMVIGNFVNCINSDLGLCLKEHALKATERLGSVRQLKLTEGITILNNNVREAKSLELSTDPETRKKQITEKLWENTSDLMKNSDLELSFNGPEDDEEQSRAIDTVDEGRSKSKKESKKKIKMLMPLLMLAKAKAIALVVVSLVVIAASLFKIAVLAKIAFIAKLIALLKQLLHKKHQEEEHGWAPHGHHEDHGWEGGWSRSRNDANNLAYSAYTS